jgi:RNA polymerase sigma-70 factor (ECF subfamily)
MRAMQTGKVIELSAAKPRSRELAIEALNEHGPILLAAARVIALDDDEAKDLVQTTFEIALRRIDTLRDPSALRAWLLRIETREAFRVVRRLRRVVRLDGHVRELVSPGSDLAAGADMRQALMTLPGRTRAAVALHHLAGLSVRETADALGVTENTIKSQLKTGLARLREVLDDG